jgi:hypothetical protein
MTEARKLRPWEARHRPTEVVRRRRLLEAMLTAPTDPPLAAANEAPRPWFQQVSIPPPR